MKNIEQLDFFLEQNPELKERFERAQFKVALFGGSSHKESVAAARQLAYSLTKKYHRVVSGGYKSGVMGSAIEGAEAAIKDMKADATESQYVEQFKPMPIGVTMEGFKQDKAARGRDIQSKVVETFFDRKRELVTEPSAFVIFEGGMGSGAEVTDTIQHNMKLAKQFKPMIFIGAGKARYDKLLNAFGEDIKEDETKNYVHYADNINDTEKLLELFYAQTTIKDAKANMTLEELQLLETTKPFREGKVVAGKMLPVKFVVDMIEVLPDGRIPMIKRAKEPFMDKLCLPGGHIEQGETPRRTAVREAKEEIGAASDEEKFKKLKYVGEFSDPNRDPRDDAQRISYGFMYEAGDSSKYSSGSDAREVVLVNPNDLKPEEVGFDHYQIIKAAGLIKIDVNKL